jgi:hypothetical protein
MTSHVRSALWTLAEGMVFENTHSIGRHCPYYFDQCSTTTIFLEVTNSIREGDVLIRGMQWQGSLMFHYCLETCIEIFN